ncbi:chymotrypsin-like protease CTRL-1 [Paramacrobiotus metropolitanus]|uniref:chymotrypsin-like protease CTRL-1 n=1 Tax=Paramacrobiotus metropolitanus TaxID=2943436 RepID=UPI0024457914|nr:chymotrypsin-like protease CTRL-1 [Paramacrobiotus metropolitanus]
MIILLQTGSKINQMEKVTRYLFSILWVFVALLSKDVSSAICGQERSAKDIYHIKDQKHSHHKHALGSSLQTALGNLAMDIQKEKRKKGNGKSNRIVGGSDVNDPTGGRLCWQVMMQLNGRLGSVRCGGSIIGSRTILTAAHCVSTNRGSGPGGAIFPASMMEIMVGALDEAYNGSNPQHGAANCARKFDVAKIIRHPDYSKTTLNNDIALLVLTDDINLDSTCACPVCLQRRNPVPGEWCINSGFGQESESGEGDNNPLPFKYIYQQILQNYEDPRCQYDSSTDGNDFVCAGGVAGIDNCYGDSGGPLVCHSQTSNTYYQVGLVSYGQFECGSGDGSRYTNVIRYLDWIVANSNGNVAIA